jgi:hypothetical protein
MPHAVGALSRHPWAPAAARSQPSRHCMRALHACWILSHARSRSFACPHACKTNTNVRTATASSPPPRFEPMGVAHRGEPLPAAARGTPSTSAPLGGTAPSRRSPPTTTHLVPAPRASRLAPRRAAAPRDDQPRGEADGRGGGRDDPRGRRRRRRPGGRNYAAKGAGHAVTACRAPPPRGPKHRGPTAGTSLASSHATCLHTAHLLPRSTTRSLSR